MTFTREDILKIQNALLQLGRKDSEFKDANTPLNSDDYIAILQDGINKKVSINNLLSTLGLLKKDDFINVSDRYDEYYIQLSEAITIIANNKRKKGLVITFQDIDGNWRIYQFIGELSNFIITDYWKDLHDFKYPIINTVLPDEEDLTLTYPNIEGNSFIKLKDKEYNLDNFSGLGKVILRKNIVEVEDHTYGKIKKNILTQDMINEPNTIYEIKYDFDLNGEEIIVPYNCVLKFEGGYLKNGTLSGELCFSGYYIDVLKGISLQKIKNVAIIDYRYIFNNNLKNIFVIKNSKDLIEAKKAYNSSSDEQYWVLTNRIVADEIYLSGTANLTIIGYNNAELIYATSVYSMKKSNSALDCIHNSYKLSNYDIFHDDFSRILYSGEKDVYSEDVDMQVYEYNDGIYSSLGSSNDLYSTITSDNNRYAGFKLSDMLLNKLFGTTTLSECNLSVEKCVNIKLDYTTGYRNYRTSIHSINNGYVYFKNTNVSNNIWYEYKGDAKYNLPMRYSIINCILLKDSSTVTIDENNILYAPMSSVNLYRTDERSLLFNISKGSTVDILNLTIKYAYYAVSAKITVHIKNCKFLNNFIALNLNKATGSIIKNNKFLNSYSCALHVLFSDNTSFVFNEVKNSGLIERNKLYAVSFMYSNNGFIAYNEFVNFYTAIGLTADKLYYEDRYNCAAICYNKLYIEEDYINNLNSIIDYGAIYLSPFQKGVCSINGKTFNRSKIHANIICNSCGSYKGNGIYLDDGAYNTSVTENYIIGISSYSITMRTVASSTNSHNNTNNEISYNIVVNGEYNVGKPEGGDDNWNIDYNFIVTNAAHLQTFTNLSNAEKNKFLVVISCFYIKDNVLYVPKTLFWHLFYNVKMDRFITHNIVSADIDVPNMFIKKDTITFAKLNTVNENSKYLKIDIPAYLTYGYNILHDITIVTYRTILKITNLYYDHSYEVFKCKTDLSGGNFKSIYYKYDEENQTLQLLIESNQAKVFNTIRPFVSSYLVSKIQSASTPENTTINHLWRMVRPYPNLIMYFEGLDDVDITEWTLHYSFDKYSKGAKFMKAAHVLKGNGDLSLTIDEFNDKAPNIPFIFNSLSDATYSSFRKFDKVFYYKDKALVQGYAISEDKNQYKEYNLLGKPILKESGTFEQKPTVEQGVEIGFAYLCTNKQTEEGTTNGIMIYHKGNDVWVDALGRVVS